MTKHPTLGSVLFLLALFSGLTLVHCSRQDEDYWKRKQRTSRERMEHSEKEIVRLKRILSRPKIDPGVEKDTESMIQQHQELIKRFEAEYKDAREKIKAIKLEEINH